jgi:nucleotide-binding universal stress UspA family protein
MQSNKENTMIRKLLIAYDGSDSAKAAFDFALDLAGKYGAELHVLAVARPPEFGSEVETEAVIENSRHHYTLLLQPLKARVADSNAHFEIIVGHPAESIVLYAEDHGIDHIVVGHRGHSLFERWLLGSVARQVIAYAHCAVTIVRHKAPIK